MGFIMLLTQWICLLITTHDTKNNVQNKKVESLVIWIIPVTSLVASGTTLAGGMVHENVIKIVIYLLLGLSSVIIGNYMPKCRQNRTIGVKTTWTIKNEDNWSKTHRFTGKLWAAGGMVIL